MAGVERNFDEVQGKTPAKPCQPCSKKDVSNMADVFCEDCGEYQCHECSKVHQYFSVMATHKLIPATEAGYIQEKYDMKGLDKCLQHRKILEYLCEDDNKLCCSTCAIVNHRKCHSVVEIEEKAKVDDPGLTSLKKDLCDIDSQNWGFYQRVLRTRERLETDEKEILEEIQYMRDKVIRKFDGLKTEVSSDINTFKDKAMKKLGANEMTSGNIAAEAKSYLSNIEDVARQGTPAQQLIMSHHLKEQVRQLQQKIQRESEQFEDTEMTFKFDDFLTLPPTEMNMPGKLTTGYVKATISEKHVCREKKQENQKVNLKLLASIDLKQGEGDVGVPLYSGLDFLSNGRLVVVDNTNKTCLVYGYNLELLGSSSLSFTPLGLVSVSDNEVAVTSGPEIYFLTISKEDTITENRKIIMRSSFFSISAQGHGKFIVGTYDEPQPVKVVSSSGEEYEVGINFPTKTYPIDHSSCTYINNCNKVVITDRYAHMVIIYDIVSDTRVEVQDDKIIMEPCGLAVGPGDSIFVCSRITNTLVQISHTGQILVSIELDMEFPINVCVSKDKKTLAIFGSVKNERKLHLYAIYS